MFEEFKAILKYFKKINYKLYIIYKIINPYNQNLTVDSDEELQKPLTSKLIKLSRNEKYPEPKWF